MSVHFVDEYTGMIILSNLTCFIQTRNVLHLYSILSLLSSVSVDLCDGAGRVRLQLFELNTLLLVSNSLLQ